jgi:hypothetical protein
MKGEEQKQECYQQSLWIGIVKFQTRESGILGISLEVSLWHGAILILVYLTARLRDPGKRVRQLDRISRAIIPQGPIVARERSLVDLCSQLCNGERSRRLKYQSALAVTCADHSSSENLPRR